MVLPRWFTRSVAWTVLLALALLPAAARAEEPEAPLRFTASPVKSPAERQKLEAALRKVEGVQQVSLKPNGKLAGSVVVLVSGVKEKLSAEALTKAAARLKVTLKAQSGTSTATLTAPAKELLLEASPVKTDADRKRLTERLKRVPGVSAIALRAGTRGDSVLVSVAGDGKKLTAEAVIDAANESGFEMVLSKSTADPNVATTNPASGRGMIFTASPVPDEEVALKLTGALTRTVGVKNVEVRRGDKPDQVIVMVAGDARTMREDLLKHAAGELKIALAPVIGVTQRKTIQFIASPVATADAGRKLQATLGRVRGVEYVAFRGAQQPGSVIVSIGGNMNLINPDRVVAAGKQAGFIIVPHSEGTPTDASAKPPK